MKTEWYVLLTCASYWLYRFLDVLGREPKLSLLLPLILCLVFAVYGVYRVFKAAGEQ